MIDTSRMCFVDLEIFFVNLLFTWVCSVATSLAQVKLKFTITRVCSSSEKPNFTLTLYLHMTISTCYSFPQLSSVKTKIHLGVYQITITIEKIPQRYSKLLGS